MVTYVKRNMGILMLYLVLIGVICLINIRFNNDNNMQNNIITINK